MPGPLVVTDVVRVPERALEVRAVRSSGPGGQNVNKVSSRVELRVDLAAVEGLSDGARSRLRALAARRLAADGRLLLTSQRTRDQHRNLEDAVGKLLDLVRRSLVRPRRRLPTRVPRGAREARLEEKRRAGHRKRLRRPGPEES